MEDTQMEPKQAKVSISPRVSEATKDFYSAMFVTPTAGAEFAMEAFRVLYRKSLTELRGVFSVEELSLLVDVVNSLHLAPGMFGQHIIQDVSDSIHLEEKDKAWKVDGAELLKKLRALTRLQVGSLEVWAKAFWLLLTRYQDTKPAPPDFLKQYCGQLVDTGVHQ